MTKQPDNKRQDHYPVYINPLTDFGIKKLFCSDARGAERLLSLLRAFLPDRMKDVKSISFNPTELLGADESTKRVTFDIYGTTDNQIHIIVEMQRGQQTFFDNRIITYNCRVISQEVIRGDMKYNIPTVIAFCIMDYTSKWPSGKEDFFHAVQLKDENNNLYSDKILFCFLELSKFAAPKIGQLKDMNFPDDRHKWAYILKNMGQMEEQDLSQEDEVFRGLFEDGRFSKLTKMEKKVYKKSVLDYADVQDAIRCTREVSLKEGLEQGLLEGREEGREEGRADERRQLARNMIDEGLDFAFVARITGLSEEELAQLVASSE